MAIEIVTKETVIAIVRCAGCGAEVGVKLMKSGVPYYYCNNTTEEGPCAHHERWSKREGHVMARNFQENGEASYVTRPIERDHLQQSQDEAKDNLAGDAGEPAGGGYERPAGSGGVLEEFGF